MTAPPLKTHQQRALTDLEVKREQRRIAADYRETLGLLEAAVAPAPDVLERLEALERLAADQARMIAAQEVRIAALEARPADDEDGRARLSGEWCTAKEAAHKSGYSPSGLRKLAKKGRIVFDVDGGRRLYNIASIRAPSAASAS
jgi:hypothetical protein